MNSQRRRQIIFILWLVAAAAGFGGWGWSLTHLSLPQGTAIYANQCRDDLDLLYATAIQKAKTSIHLEIFSLSRGRIIRELNRAAERGVMVHIAYDDQHTSRLPLHPAIWQEPRRPKGLMHRKLLIVDGERILIGSANLTHDSLRYHGNLVVHLADRELAAKLTRGIGDGIRVWQVPQTRGALDAIIAEIERAQASVRVAMYTWTHPKLTDAIIAAHRRGLAVEAILDGSQARGASRKSVEALAAAGVPLRISQGPELLHHKFCWIDERVLLCGSFNWTRSAEKRNEETLLRLETRAKKLHKLWRILQLESLPESDTRRRVQGQ